MHKEWQTATDCSLSSSLIWAYTVGLDICVKIFRIFAVIHIKQMYHCSVDIQASYQNNYSEFVNTSLVFVLLFEEFL